MDIPDIFESILVDEVLAKFKSIKTTHERVDYAYNYTVNTMNLQEALPQGKQKSNEKSLELRLKGNQHFRDKEYHEAFMLYTESVAYAENDSPHLGLAYANRSAVLLHRGHYKECLEDVERALRNKYPDHLHKKLADRMKQANTLKALKDDRESIRYYRPAPAISNNNPLIPVAADCVEIKKDETFGTHIVTTRNVKEGEVISVEAPYVKKIYPESRLFHCHECFEWCLNMVPCKNCASALYCSDTCRVVAFDSYHQYECNIDSSSLERDVVFRLTILGIKEYERNKKRGQDKFPSGGYEDIYRLKTNEDKGDDGYLFEAAFGAGATFHALKYWTKFLEETTFDENTLKEIIFRNILIKRTNVGTVYKKNIDEERESIGIALYAFSSRYNHSCVSNCLLYFCGTKLVVTAVKPIKKGEQCTLSYGWNYWSHDFMERQSEKQYYYFTCSCKACIGKWPTFAINSYNDIIANLENLTDNDVSVMCAELLMVLTKLQSDPGNGTFIERSLSTCFKWQPRVKEPSHTLAMIHQTIFCLIDLCGNRILHF